MTNRVPIRLKRRLADCGYVALAAVYPNEAEERYHVKMRTAPREWVSIGIVGHFHNSPYWFAENGTGGEGGHESRDDAAMTLIKWWEERNGRS